MKRLKGMKQFRYCKVKLPFVLTVSSDLDYFKNKIHKKVRWNSKAIDLSATPNTAAFDSGIVCATADVLPCDTEEISELNCFFAPYKLMQDTIGTIKTPCKKGENPNTDNLGVAIGMVLSIIATKGSAENGNRTPYILFVKRGNLRIRGDQLDAPVVEGMNCGDFTKGDDGRYRADISEIAKRALAEERGLNVDYLISNGLLHMPEKYYFGYDATYCQWNFFGTVVVDCTIEEIIREGCYYTKDKFETKQIIGIPAEPNVLYYYLSSKMIPIHNRKGEKEKADMWITAWASVVFAMQDFYEKEAYKKPQKACLRRKRHRWLYKGYIRNTLNKLASIFVRHKHGLEAVCAALAFFLVLMLGLRSVIEPIQRRAGILDILNVLEKVASAIGTLLAAWIVVAAVRYDIVNRKDIVKLNTYWRDDDEQLLLCPEILMFRNVVLRDGNIAEDKRKVHFHYQEVRDMRGTVVPQRKCQMSYTIEAGDMAWGMRKFTEMNIEDFSWTIKCCNHTENSVRVVAPQIIQKRSIVFNDTAMGKDRKISHSVDFEIPYKAFVGKSDEEIETMLQQKITNYLCKKAQQNVEIRFKLLLEYNGQSTIVAFLESDIPSPQAYPLSYELTETSFSQNFKDDVTRVACEYAVAEYIGYKMSSR